MMLEIIVGLTILISYVAIYGWKDPKAAIEWFRYYLSRPYIPSPDEKEVSLEWLRERVRIVRNREGFKEEESYVLMRPPHRSSCGWFLWGDDDLFVRVWLGSWRETNIDILSHLRYLPPRNEHRFLLSSEQARKLNRILNYGTQTVETCIHREESEHSKERASSMFSQNGEEQEGSEIRIDLLRNKIAILKKVTKLTLDEELTLTEIPLASNYEWEICLPARRTIAGDTGDWRKTDISIVRHMEMIRLGYYHRLILSKHQADRLKRLIEEGRGSTLYNLPWRGQGSSFPQALPSERGWRLAILGGHGCDYCG